VAEQLTVVPAKKILFSRAREQRIFASEKIKFEPVKGLNS
jgi:hypothetical protein